MVFIYHQVLGYQIKILNAEWEFLNRPERLRKLVEYYFDELRLIPISPQNFTSYDRINVGDDISIKTKELENLKSCYEDYSDEDPMYYYRLIDVSKNFSVSIINKRGI